MSSIRRVLIALSTIMVAGVCSSATAGNVGFSVTVGNPSGVFHAQHNMPPQQHNIQRGPMHHGHHGYPSHPNYYRPPVVITPPVIIGYSAAPIVPLFEQSSTTITTTTPNGVSVFRSSTTPIQPVVPIYSNVTYGNGPYAPITVTYGNRVCTVPYDSIIERTDNLPPKITLSGGNVFYCTN